MQQLLDPLVLASIKNLPLVAKTVAQGFLHGMHSSIQRGTGIEFNQYRAYEPGDALANIDWKLFARSDRYFVREAERESNINLWLVIDASASMLQQSSKSADAWTKFDYARHMLASIAYIAHQQGDAIGLLGLSSNKVDFLPALSGKQQWQKLLIQLSKIQTGNQFPNPKLLQSQLTRMQSNALIFVVSDFYQQDNEIFDFMQNLVSTKTDVVGVQLESDDEVKFPYKGHIRFEDRETKQQILVSAKDARNEYLQARENFNQSVATTLEANNIQHLRANIDQPLDKTLLHFLTSRNKML